MGLRSRAVVGVGSMRSLLSGYYGEGLGRSTRITPRKKSNFALF